MTDTETKSFVTHRCVYSLLESISGLYKKAKICEMEARVGGVEFGEEQANQRT